MQIENTTQSEGTTSKVYESLRQKAEEDLQAEAHEVPPSSFLESTVVGGLAFLALFLCAYNVVARLFAPDFILDFVEEFQVYMMIWAVFLSLGTLTLMDRHVKSDFFVNMFPPKLKTAVGWFSDILGVIFSVVIVYYGFEVAYQAHEFGDVSTTMFRTPLWIYFAALPAGGLVMGIAYLVRLSRKLTALKEG
ncbi:TRAP transporter small permease [Orrella daihaiensis]|uniref:TRAP transporter small permease protein n=1 Tax=Orrella daihaiensis TaxID=2782176 RepID=A0ABY4AIP2_9BURK|nr:TRAP transporter small permease [Orrella daihaiensis]UOD49511.1 TRAP transporter small permease [Orrella daihaiensis]